MKGDDIADRLLLFAVGVLKLVKEMPQDVAGRHLSRQLIRSSTGGGANYEEARGAQSRADFVHKVSIAVKELRESLYWLKLIKQAKLSSCFKLDEHIREANELIAILTSSLKTAKNRR